MNRSDLRARANQVGNEQNPAVTIVSHCHANHSLVETAMGDVDGVEAYLEAQVDEKVRSRRASGMMREAGGCSMPVCYPFRYRP